MKPIILLIIFTFLLLPLAWGADLEECKGILTKQESPCYLLLTNTSGVNCNTINVSVYNNASTFLYKEIMSPYSPFKCKATFNQTALGTYTFEYRSTVSLDTGSIIIQKSELKMISIMLGLIAVALFFYALAYFNTSLALKIFGYGNVLVQIFNIVFLLYANEVGNDLTLTLKTNFIVTLIGISALTLIAIFFITLKLLMPSEDNSEFDPLKWNGIKWEGRR